MTTHTAASMARLSHAVRRKALGDKGYRQAMRNIAARGGAAGKGRKRKPRASPR
jgi:hypothetical protein